jgi:hypothetical protein
MWLVAGLLARFVSSYARGGARQSLLTRYAGKYSPPSGTAKSECCRCSAPSTHFHRSVIRAGTEFESRLVTYSHRCLRGLVIPGTCLVHSALEITPAKAMCECTGQAERCSVFWIVVIGHERAV